MPTGVDLVRMPGFQAPSGLDFSPLERALAAHMDAAFRDRADKREADRLGLDRERLGLDRQRLGFEGARIGLERERMGLEQRRFETQSQLERDRFGLQQQQDQRAASELERQERERQTTRLGNLAFRFRTITDPETRRAEGGRWIAGTPGLADSLTRAGIDPNNTDQALDYIINQVQDATERYRAPNPINVVPGATLVQPTPDPSAPGGTRYSPAYTAPKPPAPMSDTQLEALTKDGTEFNSVLRLNQTFDDRYVVPGAVSAFVGGGRARNWYGRVGTNATPEVQAAARWWQDYQQNVELPVRNKMFGSALTAQEQRAWEAANITPEMNPAVIRANLAQRQQILQDAIVRRTRGLVANGHDPRTIASAYGIDPAVLTAPQTRSVQTVPVGPDGAAQGPAEGTRRTLNGKSYIYRNGQWFQE